MAYRLFLILAFFGAFAFAAFLLIWKAPPLIVFPTPGSAPPNPVVSQFLAAMGTRDFVMAEDLGASWPAGATAKALAAHPEVWGLNFSIVHKEEMGDSPFCGRDWYEGVLVGRDGIARRWIAFLEFERGRSRVAGFSLQDSPMLHVPRNPEFLAPGRFSLAEPVDTSRNGRAIIAVLALEDFPRLTASSSPGRFTVAVSVVRHAKPGLWDLKSTAVTLLARPDGSVVLESQGDLPEDWRGGKADVWIKLTDSETGFTQTEKTEVQLGPR